MYTHIWDSLGAGSASGPARHTGSRARERLLLGSRFGSAFSGGGWLGSAARSTVTSMGLFGSAARSTALAGPPCSSVRYSTSNSNQAWNSGFPSSAQPLNLCMICGEKFHSSVLGFRLQCSTNRSTKFDVYTGGVKKSLPKIFVGRSVYRSVASVSYLGTGHILSQAWCVLILDADTQPLPDFLQRFRPKSL
jgi:hypothetical protein